MLNKYLFISLLSLGLLFLILIPSASAYGPWWENLTAGATYRINYTANGTFEVPTGLTSIEIITVGGGGGGVLSSSSGGGGSGGDFRRTIAATTVSLENLTIVIGAGGVAAATTGQDGGNTTVRSTTNGILLQSAGGGGGTLASVRAQYGTSTTLVTGTITGGTGGAGGTAGGNAGCGGGGGAGGWYGDGGAAGAYVTTLNGASSTGGGGGGGGGSATGGAICGGGGGVGILAAGNNGTGGATSTTQAVAGTNGSLGQNGSGSTGGLYGGGGAGDDAGTAAGPGKAGAVVIVFTMPAQFQLNLMWPDPSTYNINVTQGTMFNITVNATCKVACQNISFSMPYNVPITNCTDLQNMNLSLNNTYYYLTNNIDCSDTVNWDSGAGFNPIGLPEVVLCSSTLPNNQNRSLFKGTLDGNYYNISNLYIYRPNSCYVALIGYADYYSPYNTNNITIIKNLGIKNANITGNNYTAGFCARCDANNANKTFENIFIENSYITGVHSVGGIFGIIGGGSSPLTDNVRATNVTIFTDSWRAGLIGGSMQGAGLINSYAQGKIIVKNTASFAATLVNGIGGLVGTLAIARIVNSYADVNISFTIVSQANRTGGLVGFTSGNTSWINNSFATGSINNNTNNIGGIMGAAGTDCKSFANITNSYWNNISLQASTEPSKAVGCAGNPTGTATAIQNNIAYFTTMTNSPMANWTADNKNIQFWSTSKDGVALPILQWEYITPPRTGYVYNISSQGYKASSSWLPFFSNDSNPRIVTSIAKDGTQIIIFFMNASGDVGTYDYWAYIESTVGGIVVGRNTTRHFNVTIIALSAPYNTSCNYTGAGDWRINCSDNCEVSSVVNVGGYDVIINGTGIIKVRADIYNIRNILTYGTSTTSRCEIYCIGGCFKKK